MSGLEPYSHCSAGLGQTEPALGAMIGHETGVAASPPLEPVPELPPLEPVVLEPVLLPVVLEPLALEPVALEPLALEPVVLEPLLVEPLDAPAAELPLAPLWEPAEAPDEPPLAAAPLPASELTEKASPPHAPSHAPEHARRHQAVARLAIVFPPATRDAFAGSGPSIAP
jgi:hypothetical protein